MAHRRNGNDLHAGLRLEVMGRETGANVEFIKARVIHGKDQIAIGIHASTSTFQLSGVSPMEYLTRLGFAQQECSVASRNPALCLRVDESFDVEQFAAAFSDSFEAFVQAGRKLERCGFYLEARDFPAKQWARGPGDGHNGTEQTPQRESEDENFEFKFTSLKQNGQIGWTTHFRPKHGPMSTQLSTVAEFLGIKRFDHCIEFEFDACNWRHVVREVRGDSLFGANNDTVFGWFDALAEHFSPGIERLLAANERMARFGLGFLERAATVSPRVRTRPTAPRTNASPQLPSSQTPQPDPELPDHFDIAISFAGTEREMAEELATAIRDAGFSVFYDNFYPAHLWGKHLTEFFDEIYRRRSKFCVMFISAEYRDRIWTTMERRSALAKALELRGQEYVLPIIVEAVDIDGLPPTIGHVSSAEYTIQQIADLVKTKLGAQPRG